MISDMAQRDAATLLYLLFDSDCSSLGFMEAGCAQFSHAIRE